MIRCDVYSDGYLDYQLLEETIDNLYYLFVTRARTGDTARFFYNGCEFSPVAQRNRHYRITEYGADLTSDMDYHTACMIADEFRAEGWKDISVVDTRSGRATSEVYYD